MKPIVKPSIKPLLKTLWQPTDTQKKQSSLWQFANKTKSFHYCAPEDYSGLHKWSINDQQDFYNELWDFLEIVGNKGDEGEPCVIANKDMRKTQFYPDATLNYAENLLQNSDDRLAIIAYNDNGKRRSITRKQLYAQVSSLVQFFKAEGISQGDRVAAITCNDIEAIISYLATAAIGAIWASCSPDFGPTGARDRLSQISPTILIAVANYHYAGKYIDCTDAITAVAEACQLQRIILLGDTEKITNTLQNFPCISWADCLATYQPNTIHFAQLPYEAPLTILFSSGTTGKPKCIIHSAMGLLIQHKKEQMLHCDIKKNERFFYYTTCGWMMWNWLISGLSLEATLVTYDGNPFHPHSNSLVDIIDHENISVFGTSAKYIASCQQAGLSPKCSHTLNKLRLILSTGSPLIPSSFEYLYREWKSELQVASISGGTDICGCFLGGNPILPVVSGQLQCALLGMDIDILDEQGNTVTGSAGELVCKQAHLSMPLGFWQDHNNTQYFNSYFTRFKSLWCQGDYAEKYKNGGYIIHGRSDTTLNPGGVRIGTAEIYRQLEPFKEIKSCIVVGQSWQRDQRIILFVTLNKNIVLTEKLITSIKTTIRSGATPRHVPAKIIAVDEIPITRSGKISEAAVIDSIHGKPIENINSLANPHCLNAYKNHDALQN